MPDVPNKLQVMQQQQTDKDTVASPNRLSEGQALTNHSILLSTRVLLTLFSLLLSYTVLQWLHFHMDSLCTCMRLTHSSITSSQPPCLLMPWIVRVLLLHLRAYLYCAHSISRRGGQCRGGCGCSAQVQRRIIVGLAVSAVTVERPKQLRSPHPHHTPPFHPRPLFFPSLCPTSKGVCGMASAELAAWLEPQHLGPSIV